MESSTSRYIALCTVSRAPPARVRCYLCPTTCDNLNTVYSNNTNTLRDSTAAAGTAGATEAILTAERALALLQNAGQAEKDAKQGSQQATMRRLIPSVEDKVTGVGETLRAWEGASKS